MRTHRHDLPPGAPGSQAHWVSLHFLGSASNEGAPGRKAVIQCALHADEIPGLLVGVHLRHHLEQLEREGRVEGEIVLIPAANVLGGAQAILGSQIGRFDLGTGVNFNRGYRHLTPDLLKALSGRLGADASANTRIIRQACREALQAWAPLTAVDTLKHALQTMAIDADTVLDLHCDGQALMHLYAPTPWTETGLALGRCLNARVVLLAKESGDDPFDESVSRHWWELAEALGSEFPIELGCFSTTVELRGEADVSHDLAEADARGLLAFLESRGHLAPGSVACSIDRHRAAGPALREGHGHEALPCDALPLEGVDPLTAPCGGVVVLACALGDTVKAGQMVAEVIDPLTAESTPVCTRVDGVFFAHSKTRWALRGERIGKVAGAKAFRTGKLLSL